MKTRLYNFGAGPATLPESILLEAQAELLDWQGLGVSVLEIGHRTTAFKSLLAEAEMDLRDLLAIPDDYHVLFLGGAARAQFAMVPMNLIAPNQQAGYIISGTWSSMAYDECCKISRAYCLMNRQENNISSVLNNTAYVYYTPNETVDGIRIATPPCYANIPLVADMTSCLLSEPLNIDDFGLIFAGAQKNISAAGLTIVIVRADLLERMPVLQIPSMMDYRVHVAHQSLYATPPTFNCYLAAKMLKWIKTQGGVAQLYQQNCQKAEKLYAYIDSCSFYQTHVEKTSRSIMNVCFYLANTELEPVFLQQANQQGLYALQGHRTVGGLRASLYNAMPMAGVDALIAFMQAFSKAHS